MEKSQQTEAKNLAIIYICDTILYASNLKYTRNNECNSTINTEYE